MAGISSLGIGSGIDVQGIIESVLKAEGEPKVKRLDTQETDSLLKISAYAKLKNTIYDFQDAIDAIQTSSKSIDSRQVSYEDEDYYDVLTTSDAQKGNYGVKVTTLATAMKKVMIMSFDSEDTVVGTGTLRLTIDGSSHDIAITDVNSTLGGIRDAINEITEDTGVQAMIIMSGGDAFLSLKATETGEDAGFTVTALAPTGSFAQVADANMTEVQGAVNASVMIEGVTIVSQSNVITDAIDGVTIELKKTSGATTYQFTIDDDRVNALDLITNFVDQYNLLNDMINDLMQYQTAEEKRQTRIDQAQPGAEVYTGIFFSDATARNLAGMIRKTLTHYTMHVDSYESLSTMGIASNEKTGKLEIDSTELAAMLADHFDDVGDFFLNEDDGLIATYDTLFSQVFDEEGFIDTRTAGLRQDLMEVGRSRLKLEAYLLQYEERLKRRFVAMEGIVANLNSTGSFLTQQLKGFVKPLAFRS